MKVVVFTPSQRPGFDVTHASLRRQETDAQIYWVFSDELYHERVQVVRNMLSQDKASGKLKDWVHMNITKKEGYKRNLAAGYNSAMDYARAWGADLFISLQDYIYIGPSGIQQFIDMYKDVETEREIRAIYTGITSISSDPTPDKIHDNGGNYTIFKEPYVGRPQDIDWMDVRYRHEEAGVYKQTSPLEWETNWACVPKNALYNPQLRFDEGFDKYVAYENQDYAFQAQKLGYRVLIDMNNHAISLPHKKYFPESWAEEKPLTQKNRELVESKWP